MDPLKAKGKYERKTPHKERVVMKLRGFPQEKPRRVEHL
jgi:hypothetical protein